MSFAELVEFEIGYEEFLTILDFNLERNPGVALLDFYRGLKGESVIEVKTVEYPAKQEPKKVVLKSEKELFDMVDNSKKKEFNPESPINSDDLEESNVDDLFSSKYLTYGMDEYKGTVLKCRSCFKNTIEGNTDKCPECHTQIKWF